MTSFWWQKASLSKQVGWLRGVLPIVISWALWRARRVVRMEGISFNPENVIRVVKTLIRDLSSKIKAFRGMGAHDQAIIELLACPIVPLVVRRVRLIAWQPPERGE